MRSMAQPLPGFTELAGQGIAGSDMECPGSLLPGKCALNSTLDAVTLCLEFPACRALVVLLNGARAWRLQQVAA